MQQPLIPMTRYAKPKILLVDTPPDAERQLLSRGFNVQSGTFGHKYDVATGQGTRSVATWMALPDVEEQEIVIIDLTEPRQSSLDSFAITIPEGEPDWLSRTNRGYIDPRPRAMQAYQKRLDRVLEFGGVFVVFAVPRVSELYVETTGRGGQTSSRHADNWDFLSSLASGLVPIVPFEGRELKEVTSPFESLSTMTKGIVSASTAKATIGRTALKNIGAMFHPLVINRFGDPVAGVILFERRESGQILILPQPDDKVECIVSLVVDILPEFANRLFSEFEGGKWVHRREYEHPSVVERLDKQEAALSQARQKVEELGKEIEAAREEWRFLHGILTKSGEALVKDVRRTLDLIGLSDVREVDASTDQTVANLQEDLQIHDRLPTLIVEVKGLALFPTEHDVLQVIKYVQRRMKEWKRFDVQGLVLVNCQRHLPAMDRDDERAFTAEQQEDARLNEFGIMTTWELFRLVRGMQRWKWPKTAIIDALFRKGRIGCLPDHYKPVGVLGHFYEKPHVLSIVVNAGCAIRKGDKLGMFVNAYHFEQIAESMEIDHVAVDNAPEGRKVGITTSLNRSDLPVGSIIYRVG